MADSADLAASPNSRARRASSAKRGETTVSTETENKLARAARSAQRLAQLSDVPRDDSTFDLFPDDPTRATLEAMTIDTRQGTLTGFELPAEVLAAVGITDEDDALAGESKPARRVTRAANIDEATSLSRQASVLDERVEPSIGDAAVDTTGPARAIATSAQGVHTGSNAAASAVPEVDATAAVGTDADSHASVSTEAADPARNASAKRTGASADSSAKSPAATPAVSGQPAEARAAAPVIPAAPSASSAGLRQAVAARTNETTSVSQPGASPPRFASTFAKAANASRDTSASGESPASSDVAAATSASAPRTSSFGAQAQPTPAGAASRSSGTPQTSSATNTAAPELDRARATAFADTVDALYGVIADQRRAATDHSRRMKWMLSIVVAALLVTVAIGITQTLLLMRLTRDSTAQQQRIEQMMLNQQATLSTLLDTDSATVSAPAIIPVPPAAPAAPAVSTKHSASTRHAHKTKTKPAH
ncbi:hypothetical protein R69919_02451 [Paraburkholderia gardini]|nr:hypothetical protein R69919_02451 [Paraburkholderia gardini]